MKNVYLIICLTLLCRVSFSQCEGCVIDPTCTASPAAPALCPEILPNALQGEPYEIDLTFFMPNQFTDGGTGATVTLSQITITSVSGLPNGISWTTNEADNIYDITSDPATQRGCVKMCGTPQAIGSYTISVNVIASVTAPISTDVPQSFTLPLLVVPGGGGNSGFSFSPSSGCDSIAVGFEALISSETQPVTYLWDFGNGNMSTEPLPETQLYLLPDTYYVNLQTDLLEYVLTNVNFNATGSNWCGDIEEPSIPFIGTCTGSPDIYFIYTVGSATQQSSTVDNSTSFSVSNLEYVINQPSFSLAFFDEDLITADDNLGSTVIQVNDIGTFNFNTNQGFGSYTISTRVSLSFNNEDTVIVFPSPQTPEIMLTDSLVCEGDSITLTTGFADFYQWNSSGGVAIFGANDSTYTIYDTGVFSVEVRNSQGCIAFSDSVSTVVASLPDAPSIFFNPISEQLICNPGSNFTWSWYVNGNEIPGTENQGSLSPETIGDYTVTVENASGCSVESAAYAWTNVGIAELIGNFKLYPNPSQGGFIYLEGIQEGIQVVLTDLSGRSVYNQALPSGWRKEFNPGYLEPGVYIVNILKGETAFSIRLVITQR
ncbi:MAG: T9SS type A sorting domain-containing protein [Bacteroidia bacterium]